MMDPRCEVDSCRLCGFIFLVKRRKRNFVGEFAKKFETVVGVEVLEGDKCRVCDTCKYRVEKILVEWEGYSGATAKKKTPNFSAEFNQRRSR